MDRKRIRKPDSIMTMQQKRSKKQVSINGKTFLCADDARKVQRRRFKLLQDTFDTILKEVLQKVESLCKERLYTKSLRYSIPGNIVGCPLYKCEDARFYVRNKLRKLGYKADWPENSSRILTISWERPNKIPGNKLPILFPLVFNGGGEMQKLN